MTRFVIWLSINLIFLLVWVAITSTFAPGAVLVGALSYIVIALLFAVHHTVTGWWWQESDQGE